MLFCGVYPMFCLRTWRWSRTKSLLVYASAWSIRFQHAYHVHIGVLLPVKALKSLFLGWKMTFGGSSWAKNKFTLQWIGLLFILFFRFNALAALATHPTARVSVIANNGCDIFNISNAALTSCVYSVTQWKSNAGSFLISTADGLSLEVAASPLLLFQQF